VPEVSSESVLKSVSDEESVSLFVPGDESLIVLSVFKSVDDVSSESVLEFVVELESV